MKMKMFMKQINCKVSSNKSQNKQLLQDGPSNKSTQWLCSNFAGHCNSIFGQNHSWVRRRACVIHRVVDSWLGMLPPVGAKYTHQAGAGRRCARARYQRSRSGTEVLARKPAKELRYRARSGLSLNREDWVVALHCALSPLPPCIIG